MQYFRFPDVDHSILPEFFPFLVFPAAAINVFPLMIGRVIRNEFRTVAECIANSESLGSALRADSALHLYTASESYFVMNGSMTLGDTHRRILSTEN